MDLFIDPISHRMLTDPVRVSCGHIFEKIQLEGWMEECRVHDRPSLCPLDRETVSLCPEMVIKSALSVLNHPRNSGKSDVEELSEGEKKQVDDARLHALHFRELNRIANIPDRMPEPVSFMIGEWKVGQGIVYLSRVKNEKRPNLLGFSDDRTPKRSTFACDLYDVDYAIELTHTFRHTIGKILEREVKPHSSYFLPKICVSAHNNKAVTVALFGHLDTSVNPVGELRGLQWGVHDSSNGQKQSFEVHDDVAKQFIQAEIRQEMSSYANQYRVELKYGVNGMEGVVLQQTSVLDNNTVLDENNWAVTLVSAKDTHIVNTRIADQKIKIGNTGHAMIVYEGVENGKRVARGFDLTTIPVIKEGKAHIEDRDQILPLEKLLVGPTWSRAKDLVEAMIYFKDQLIKEASNSFEFAFAAPVMNGGGLDASFAMYCERFDGKRSENCISFCVFMLRSAGIFLDEPTGGSFFPNDYIKKLQSESSVTKYNEEDKTIRVSDRNSVGEEDAESKNAICALAELCSELIRNQPNQRK